MKKFLTLFLALGVGVCVGQLFEGSPPKAEAGGGTPVPPCLDINGDGVSNVTDAVFLLQWQFGGGPEPSCPPANVQSRELPDTGQSECYGLVGDQWVPVPCGEATCPGQDVSYTTGCSGEGRFTDNGDGTVTDNCTGLMWQKETAGKGNADEGDGGGGLVPVVGFEWCEALAYCEDLSFAGHDDWRLPNVRELQSIADYGRGEPAMDPIFGGPEEFSSTQYWSSTSGFANPGLGWFVDFYDGRVDCVGPRGDYYSVRAVRSVR